MRDRQVWRNIEMPCSRPRSTDDDDERIGQ